MAYVPHHAHTILLALHGEQCVQNLYELRILRTQPTNEKTITKLTVVSGDRTTQIHRH